MRAYASAILPLFLPLLLLIIIIIIIIASAILQDPMFDKIIKALYGNVDQYDAEVRQAVVAFQI
jgi:hypothetical protein